MNQKNVLDNYITAYNENFQFSFDNNIILKWYPRRIMDLTNKYLTMLELGVGHGYTSDMFSNFYSEYVVMDASPAVLEQFKRQYPNSPAKVYESYFEEYRDNQKYDIVMMGFILEHVDDPAKVLNHFKQFLKKDGRLFVAVPNAASLHRRIGNKAGVLDNIMELGKGDIELGHRRLYTVETLSKELIDCGYTVVRKEGIFLKPFTTNQMVSLNLPENILAGMCRMGIEYPELSASLLFEARL